jgi:2-dehydropantoate 2-reductase
MSIAVVGTGAVGGYFGGKLASTGLPVSFLARGAHLTALRRDGLTVESPAGDFRVRARFTDRPEEIGPVDLILFCVKSYDTESASRALEPLFGPRTTLVSLQNGIDNPDRLARRWGAERVLAGVVYLGARLARPGLIVHEVGGRLAIGALEGAASERAETVRATFARAAIPCEVRSDIRAVMWRKLAWNAPFCALSALLGLNVREILESEPLRRLVVACIEEVREAARLHGVALPASAAAETLELAASLGPVKPSMLQDVEAVKPLEHEALNGVVAKTLRAAGHGASINETFYAMLDFLDRKNRSRK